MFHRIFLTSFCFLFVFSAHSFECELLLTQSESVFQKYEKLESNLNQVITLVQLRFASKSITSNQYTVLNSFLTDLAVKLDHIQDTILNDGNTALYEIEELEQSLNEILVQTLNQNIGSEVKNISSDFSTLIVDPDQIKAEHYYDLNATDGRTYKVYFSHNIVENFLNNPLFNPRKLLQKFIYGMHGGSYKGSGMIHLENLDMVEVRTVGGRLNRLRLLGYIKGNSIFIVYWTNNEHTSSNTSAASNIVHKIRRQMGN